MQSSEMRTQIIFQILFIISSLFHVVNFSVPIISGRGRDKIGAGGGKGGGLGGQECSSVPGKFHFCLVSRTGCGGRGSRAGAELGEAAVFPQLWEWWQLPIFSSQLWQCEAVAKTSSCGGVPQKSPEESAQKKRKIFYFHREHHGLFLFSSWLPLSSSGFWILGAWNYLCSLRCLCWS